MENNGKNNGKQWKKGKNEKKKWKYNGKTVKNEKKNPTDVQTELLKNQAEDDERCRFHIATYRKMMYCKEWTLQPTYEFTVTYLIRQNTYIDVLDHTGMRHCVLWRVLGVRSSCSVMCEDEDTVLISFKFVVQSLHFHFIFSGNE